MKKITKNTILKQGDNTYHQIEINGGVYWYDIKEIRIDNNTIRNDIIGKLAINKRHNHIGIITDINERSVTVSGTYNPTETGCSIFDSLMINGFSVHNLIVFDEYGYESNSNKYTQKDIEKAIDLASNPQRIMINGLIREHLTKEEILEQINSISVINVDNKFNVLNYE
jgi:hypothetical protein